MEKILKAIIVLLIIAVNFACNKDKKPCENDVFPLLMVHCNNGPSSCVNDTININGYLDGINIYDNKFFLYENQDCSSQSNACYNNQSIEVKYPVTDLSNMFPKVGDHYDPAFDVKVVIQNAVINIFYRNSQGRDDGNYLTVDSIQQIEFYKIENNGNLTKLDL